MTKKTGFLFLFFIHTFCNVFAQANALGSYKWTTLDTKGEPTARHESSFVVYKNKFYLIGGRGVNPVNVFDPMTHTWIEKNKTPLEIHHFQAVVYKDAIYIIGAMSGKYPTEKPLEHIWKYFPEKDLWVKGDPIPTTRQRGGAGAVLYKDKIYLACGIDLGHTSGTNNNFDSYDLVTGKWEVLTKAPNIRDHFSAIVVADKLYCIGGRNTSFHYPENFGAFFEETTPYIDVYDFKSNNWVTLKSKLPFPTAAGGLVYFENKIVYIGGEGILKQAYNTTQFMDLESKKWEQLATLTTGRHSGGSVVYDGKIYTVAGSPKKGGGNLSSMEVFSSTHDWKSLFNGKDLVGWKILGSQDDIEKKFWIVDQDGILCNSLHSTKHNHVWLQNQLEFSDFELRLKFKASDENKGNSGVQLRSQYDPTANIELNGTIVKGWMEGPQVDIDSKDSWRNGLLYDETREYKRWIYPKKTDWKIEKESNPNKKNVYYSEKELSGWNDMTIICKGNNIKTYVNNMLVSDFDGEGVLNDAAHKNHNVGLKGRIALQCHMNSKNKIWFKDIEIREIKK